MKIAIEKDRNGKEWLIVDGEQNTITVSRKDKACITLDKSILDRFSDEDTLRVLVTNFDLYITEDGDSLWKTLEKAATRWKNKHSSVKQLTGDKP